MIQRKILCDADYLHIPVIPDGERNEMQIWAGGDLIASPLLALADEGGEYFFLNVSQYKGRELMLFAPTPKGISQKSLARIVCGGAPAKENPLYPQLYREPLRPAYHFSSRRGWLNDPNGLVYKDGVFHMFYQHNPFGTTHGAVNICWGHAVSTDLIFWEEKDDAIRPWRRDWSIASGSAVVDEKNHAGYGKGAIIAAFTVLGTLHTDPAKPCYPHGGQFLAASTDGGNTFYRFSHEAVVPAANNADWRDPRLFCYGDHYVMAVYERDEKDRNCVSFYVSQDFHNWERASRSENLYECPDIFPLQVEGETKSRWVLYGADGLARIGDFDGRRFAESGQQNPLDYGDATYAGQTWSNHPDGKRVHISWIRGMGNMESDMGYEGMPFSQCMSVPGELFLRRFGDALRVCRRPVEQVRQLVGETIAKADAKQQEETALPMHNPACYTVRLSDAREKVAICAGKHVIFWDPLSAVLSFENGRTALLDGKSLDFEVLTDTTTVEFCFENSIMATYAMPADLMSLAIKGKCHMQYTCRSMKNIWE